MLVYWLSTWDARCTSKLQFKHQHSQCGRLIVYVCGRWVLCVIQCEVVGIRCIAIFGAGKMKFIKLQSKHISNRSDIDDNDDDDQQQCVYPTKRTVSLRSNKHAKPHVVRLGMCVCVWIRALCTFQIAIHFCCRLMIKCRGRMNSSIYFFLLPDIFEMLFAP